MIREMTGDNNRENHLIDVGSKLQNLLNTELVCGDEWFLVDMDWFQAARKYLCMDDTDGLRSIDESINPGPIDNKPLFQEDGINLRENLLDDRDYVLVPREGWRMLVSTFGIEEDFMVDTHVVRRNVVKHGMWLIVEVYLTEFQLAVYCDGSLGKTKMKKFSLGDTLRQIEDAMRIEFWLLRETRLWKQSRDKWEELDSLDITVQDAGLFPQQLIVIEERNENGSWPWETSSSHLQRPASSTSNNSLSNDSTRPSSSLHNTSLGSVSITCDSITNSIDPSPPPSLTSPRMTEYTDLDIDLGNDSDNDIISQGSQGYDRSISSMGFTSLCSPILPTSGVIDRGI